MDRDAAKDGPEDAANFGVGVGGSTAGKRGRRPESPGALDVDTPAGIGNSQGIRQGIR